MTQAYVDIDKGTVTSDEHVDVKLLNGTLSADRLRIINSGEVVRFEGNVVMNLDHGQARRQPEPEPEPPPPPQDAVRHRQVRQHEMIFMMQFFSRSFARGRRFALALIAVRRRLRAGRHVGRAQCDAGLFAKSRPADPDRSGVARNARQEKGGDLRRQRQGGAGRHHHDLENAGGVLRSGAGAGHGAAGQGRRARNPRRCSRDARDPAAVRRSAGSRPRATSW